MEKLGKPITEIFMQKTPSRFLKAKSLRILWYVQKNTLFYCIYICILYKVFWRKTFFSPTAQHLLTSKHYYRRQSYTYLSWKYMNIEIRLLFWECKIQIECTLSKKITFSFLNWNTYKVFSRIISVLLQFLIHNGFANVIYMQFLRWNVKCNVSVPISASRDFWVVLTSCYIFLI